MPTNRSVGVVALRSRGVVRSDDLPGLAMRPQGSGNCSGSVADGPGGVFTLTHGREGLRGIELTRRWTPE